MNHLIDGCHYAINNGHNTLYGSIIGPQSEFHLEFKAKMKEVLAHYENGGTLETRP